MVRKFLWLGVGAGLIVGQENTIAVDLANQTHAISS
jgi:hypothetical protein